MIMAHTEASLCCPRLAVDSPDWGIRQRRSTGRRLIADPSKRRGKLQAFIERASYKALSFDAIPRER